MSARKSKSQHHQLAVDQARKLILKNYAVIPLYLPGEKMANGREATGKEPRDKGWSKADVGEVSRRVVLGRFHEQDSNVGVRLGKYSGELLDVDMDCRETIYLGNVWLPETGMVFGRESAPASHRIYTAENDREEYKTQKFTDVRAADGKKATMLEIRSTGAQTAFPGTLHKSGEIVEWERDKSGEALDGSPGDSEGLKLACEKVMAGALLARHWPEGTYHDGSLALAGGLARAGWDIETTKDFIWQVGSVVGMANLDDRMRTVEDTFEKFAASENIVGWPSAVEIFGEDVIKRVRDHLKISKDLVAEQGELELRDEIPWVLFPDVKTKLVDGERVITGLKGTYDNLTVVLNSYGIEVMYDVIMRARFYRKRGEKDWSRVDNGFRTLVDTLAARNGLPRMNLPNQIDEIASTNPVNPVVEYLEGLKWDGKDHIGQLCKGIEIVGGRHERRWMRKLLRKWFIQSAAAADGARRTPNRKALKKFESVMVLLGRQGTQKTSWIIKLVPEHLRRYVKTALHVNPADRDSLKQATTCWLGEIGELDATFRKADISQLKAFLSQEYDEYRVPYGVDAEVYSRLTSFAASVNGFNFLQDPTGNRRFWVIEVLGIEHYVNMDQVWAQAWALYLKGEQWWLTPSEDLELHEMQREHTAIEIDPVYVAMHEAFPQGLGAQVKKDEWLDVQALAERVGLAYGLERVDVKMSRKIINYMREYSKSYRGQKTEKRPKNKVHFAVPKRGKKD